MLKVTVNRNPTAEEEVDKFLIDNEDNSNLIGFNLKMQAMEFSWHLIKDQIVKNANCQQLSVMPVIDSTVIRPSLPMLALFASKNLSISVVENLSEEHPHRFQQIKVEKIQFNVNLELVLDFSNDLIAYWCIMKHYQNKWQSKYLFKQRREFQMAQNTFKID